MSFGFSAGDFLAVGKQIKDISSLIRHASASYQALDVELHTLKRALDEIEHIQCPVGQELAINKVKVTALNCRQLLDGFESKLKKYAVLNQQHGASLGKTHALQKLGRKVEWGIEMEEEAIKLRAAIVAHVGFLNLRLSSLGLNASFFVTQKLEEHHDQLTHEIGQVRGQVVESRREQAAQGSLIAATSTLILNQVSEIASACIGVRLDSLLELAQNIWNSNVQILALVSEMQSRPPKPDTSYTWFQDPIRFEDAFGRVFPIPSEYSWSKVHAIILDQFATGPGSQKVKSGEYLLYNSLDSKNALRREHSPLIPGMSITMTLVLGRYGSPTLDRCPRVGCLSFKVVTGESGNKLCSVCRCWFRATSVSIACPLRCESSVGSATEGGKLLSGRKKRRQGLSEPSNYSMMQNLNEGQYYKNLSIYTMDLPKTPNVVNIRRFGIIRRQKEKPVNLVSKNCVVEGENESVRITLPARKARIVVDQQFPPEAHSNQSDMFDVNSVNSFLSGDTHPTSKLSIQSAPKAIVKGHEYPALPPMPPPRFGNIDQKRILILGSDDLEEDIALSNGEAHSTKTNTVSGSQRDARSVWSGSSVSGFSATSAGSFARRNHQRTKGAAVRHNLARELVGVRLPSRAVKRPPIVPRLMEDANIRTTSSSDEKLRHMKRYQMEFPEFNPVDELNETVIGHEDVNGMAVVEGSDYRDWDLDFVDKHVRSIRRLPHRTAATTLAFTRYVCRPYNEDLDILRAIFTWVAEMSCWEENVADEMDSPFGSRTRRTIQRRRGSPRDYAVLVMDMCAAVGIKCEMVRGYLKTPGEVVDTSKPMVPNHWWNAVVVHDEWRIMDCCLASPSNPNRAQFSRIDEGRTDYWWFLTRPTESCWTHVPENNSHQHLVAPIDINVLRHLPCAAATFFDNRIKMLDYNTSMTRIRDLERMLIKLEVPNNVEVVAAVELPAVTDGDGDGINDDVKNLALAQVELHKGVKRYTIKALLPVNKSRGTLKIYAGKKGRMHSIEDNPHPLAFCLPIVHSGANKPYEFVTRHPTPYVQW